MINHLELWPPSLRRLDSFKKQLKTHLFRLVLTSFGFYDAMFLFSVFFMLVFIVKQFLIYERCYINKNKLKKI